MGQFIPGGTTEVLAYQFTKSAGERAIICLHDWVHDLDSSTIYGAVSGSIMKEIEKYNGMPIPYRGKDDVYVPIKAIALDGDWIIKHGELHFTVMNDEVFRELYHKIK